MEKVRKSEGDLHLACLLQKTSPETMVAMTVLAAMSDHVYVAAKRLQIQLV